MQTSTELKAKKQELLDAVKGIDEKLDEIELASIISEYMDIEEIRKKSMVKRKKSNTMTLHGRKAFLKLINMLPQNSILHGWAKGSWWGGSHPCIFNHYILLLDEKTLLYIRYEEKFKEQEEKICSTSFFIETYAGEGKLSINVKRGMWHGDNLIIIVDSSNNYEVNIFNLSGDYSSYNGKYVSDLIKPIDLANFITKDGEDYHIQKVKNTKEAKQA